MDNWFTAIEDNSDDWPTVDHNLQLITDALKEEEYRIRLSLDDNHWLIVSHVLTRIDHHLIRSTDNCLPLDHTLLKTIAQLFRLLRNSLVNCMPNKRCIVTNGSIVDNSFDVLKRVIGCYKAVQRCDNNDLTYKQSLIQAMKCCLQYIANLLSGLDETIDELSSIRHQIWSLLAFELFRYLLDFEEDKSVVLVSSMIFYSCIRNNSDIENNLFETNRTEDLLNMLTIFELMLDQIESSSSEWCLWSLHIFLKYKNFFQCFYNRFQMKQKLIILDIIYELITNQNDMKSTENALNDTNVDYLCQLFKQSISEVFAIDSQTGDKQTEENKYNAIHITKLLSILCELTTNEHFLSRFQSDRQLIECLVNTLKTIQLLSKTKDSSHFKSMPQLKQVDENDGESQNPVFGFKRDLIRVIGNLVYKCAPMQDWVRELDGIPVILDCCNIDAKNPYIMQWSIFAIRNIVENNHSNQEIISQLSRNGVLIDDQLNQKLGIHSNSFDKN